MSGAGSFPLCPGALEEQQHLSVPWVICEVARLPSKGSSLLD